MTELEKRIYAVVFNPDESDLDYFLRRKRELMPMSTPKPTPDLAAKIAAELREHWNVGTVGDSYAPASHKRLIAVIARELAPTLDALAAAQKAAVPICVGQPIIQILAREGQWVSESGAAVIAASDLFQHDPYEALRKAEADCAALRLAAQPVVDSWSHHVDCASHEDGSLPCDCGHSANLTALEAALQATDAGQPLLDELARLRAEVEELRGRTA